MGFGALIGPQLGIIVALQQRCSTMSNTSQRSWFQRTCPHVWKIVSAEDIHDVLDPTLMIGTRSTKRCLVCGSVTKSEVR